MISFLPDFKKSARVAFIFNITASLLMVLFLKPGLDPQSGITDRLHFINTHVLSWRLSWIVWIFAALSLILFFISWALTLWQEVFNKKWIVLGCVAGIIGMVPDTIAESIYLGLMPIMAQSPSPDVLHAQGYFELAQVLTGFLGNGLYCVGGFVLNLVSLKSQILPKLWVRLGLCVWLTGFGLSAVSLMQNLDALVVFTALTMGSFTLWCAWLAFIVPTGKRLSS